MTRGLLPLPYGVVIKLHMLLLSVTESKTAMATRSELHFWLWGCACGWSLLMRTAMCEPFLVVYVSLVLYKACRCVAAWYSAFQ